MHGAKMLKVHSPRGKAEPQTETQNIKEEWQTSKKILAFTRLEWTLIGIQQNNTHFKLGQLHLVRNKLLFSSFTVHCNVHCTYFSVKKITIVSFWIRYCCSRWFVMPVLLKNIVFIVKRSSCLYFNSIKHLFRRVTSVLFSFVVLSLNDKVPWIGKCTSNV